jgi:hypothetical protein
MSAGKRLVRFWIGIRELTVSHWWSCCGKKKSCECDCENCAPVNGEYVNNAPCCWRVTISGINAASPESCTDCESLNEHYYVRQDYGDDPDSCLWKGVACHCDISEITLSVVYESGEYKARVVLGDHVWEKNFGSERPVCCGTGSSHDLTWTQGGTDCDSSESTCRIVPSSTPYCESTIAVTFEGVYSVDCDCIHCHYLNTTTFYLTGNPLNGWSAPLCQGVIPYGLCSYNRISGGWTSLGGGAWKFEIGIGNSSDYSYPRQFPWIIWRKDFSAEEYVDWTSFDGQMLDYSDEGGYIKDDGLCTANDSTATVSLFSLGRSCPLPECSNEWPTGNDPCYCHHGSKPTKVLVRIPNGYSQADISGEYLLEMLPVSSCSFVLSVGGDPNNCNDVSHITFNWLGSCGIGCSEGRLEIKIHLRFGFGVYDFMEFRRYMPRCENWGEYNFDCWFGGKEYEIPFHSWSAWNYCPGTWDGSPITVEAIE